MVVVAAVLLEEGAVSVGVAGGGRVGWGMGPGWRGTVRVVALKGHTGLGGAV